MARNYVIKKTLTWGDFGEHHAVVYLTIGKPEWTANKEEALWTTLGYALQECRRLGRGYWIEEVGPKQHSLEPLFEAVMEGREY